MPGAFGGAVGGAVSGTVSCALHAEVGGALDDNQRCPEKVYIKRPAISPP